MKLSTVTTPPATPTLVPLATLDADRDGRLTVRDAERFEARADDGPAADRAAALWMGQQARIGAALLPNISDSPNATVATLLPTGLAAGQLAARDAVRGVAELDVARLRATGTRLVSTFDFDNTIATGDVLAPVVARLASARLLDPADTSFRDVMRSYGIPAEDWIGPVNANDDAQTVMRAIIAAGRTVNRELVTAAFFATSSALRGVPVAAAQSIAREVLRNGATELGLAPLRQRLIDASPAAGDSALDLWHASDRAGIQPWMVTFGFEWIAREAAEVLGLPQDRVVGWTAEQQAGRFTGVSPRDGDKSSMIRDRVGGVPIIAVGDSSSDLPMLDLAVGRAIVVNPTTSMQDADRARGGRFTTVNYGSGA